MLISRSIWTSKATLREDPHLARFRADTDDPAIAASVTEKPAPMLVLPFTERELPKLAVPVELKLFPEVTPRDTETDASIGKVGFENAETEPCSIVGPLTVSELPKQTDPRVLDFPPHASEPRVEIESPILAGPYKDKELPKKAALNDEKAEPEFMGACTENPEFTTPLETTEMLCRMSTEERIEALDWIAKLRPADSDPPTAHDRRQDNALPSATESRTLAPAPIRAKLETETSEPNRACEATLVDFPRVSGPAVDRAEPRSRRAETDTVEAKCVTDPTEREE